MPEIARFFGIVIKMYAKDHAPPHFHMWYGSFSCAIDIRTHEVIAGWVPRRALALTLEWAAEHQEGFDGGLEPMRERPGTETNLFAGVSNVPWHVTQVDVLPGYRLLVEFVDGTKGEVDASRLILAPSAGVFTVLRDPARFAKARAEDGVVTWPGELDLAPDAMYYEIKERGRWVLDPF